LSTPLRIDTPAGLLAELTHRCPLGCAYCSNPLELESREKELETWVWKRVFSEAADLGVLHVHLSGGEPAARRGLEEIVAHCAKVGLYTNLITSGIGLTEERVSRLGKAGLDHVQLSLQGAQAAAADLVAGAKAHERKLQAAAAVRAVGMVLTINVVLHRGNATDIEALAELAADLGADRLELAHAQYYGWALRNRGALLPTRDQWERSLAVITAARERLKGRMRVDFVAPDYYAKYPKACMGGWGRGVILIDPAGRALPCHAAGSIPGLGFDNVRTRTLRWIWEESTAFQKFRGEDWMPEPCRGCDRRALDFGGCRCQALALTADATATDPVCTLSPAHGVVETVIERVNAMPVPHGHAEWVYRIDPPSA